MERSTMLLIGNPGKPSINGPFSIAMLVFHSYLRLSFVLCRRDHLAHPVNCQPVKHANDANFSCWHPCFPRWVVKKTRACFVLPQFLDLNWRNPKIVTVRWLLSIFYSLACVYIYTYDHKWCIFIYIIPIIKNICTARKHRIRFFKRQRWIDVHRDTPEPSPEMRWPPNGSRFRPRRQIPPT